jgi:hypothetical protein
MLKSTSQWAGSAAQVEYCAKAMGAASARMPVTNTKRFIVQNPFDAGPLGRFWVGEERSALAGRTRGVENLSCAALNLLMHIGCRGQLLVATNILEFFDLPSA